MADLLALERQDLINLQKVINIDRSDDACYELDGKAYSMYQRKQKGYRINVKGSSEVYMFVFSSKNKPVAVIAGKLDEQA